MHGISNWVLWLIAYWPFAAVLIVTLALGLIVGIAMFIKLRSAKGEK